MKRKKFEKKTNKCIAKILDALDGEDLRVIMTAMSISYLELHKQAMETQSDEVMQRADHVAQVMISKLFEQRTGVTIEQARNVLLSTIEEAEHATIQ